MATFRTRRCPGWLQRQHIVLSAFLSGINATYLIVARSVAELVLGVVGLL